MKVELKDLQLSSTFKKALEELAKTTYKQPQTILDIIENRTILLEIIDKVLDQKGKDDD